MINHYNRRVRGDRNSTILLFSYSLVLVSVLSSIQLNNFKIFASDAWIENALSEGGQICPLESECDRQNENQTDAHNMTVNVPAPGKTENGQGSIGGSGSIVNNLNNVQNETNLANDTLVNGEIKNSISDVINITTDKQIYNPGEIVGISIKNLGSEQLTFPNSALGLKIRNLASNELYPILSSQVITILGPGDSKSLQWDQIGIDGNQVPSGNYSASVNSGINTAETSFSIE
jgi:glutaredoxin-related protein